MKFFSGKKKPVGNARRVQKKAKPVRKPMRWIKPMLQGVAVSAAVVLSGFGVWKLNDKLSVSYWDIDAEHGLKAQIEAVLQQQEHMDYWRSRASYLQAELVQQLPDIESVQISRVLPDGLLIKAKARTPVALWEDVSGQVKHVMLIDKQGDIYRQLQHGETLDLPILRLKAEDVAQAVQLLDFLYHHKAEKLLNLSEVIVAEHGWRLNFSRGEQWKVDTANLEYDLTQIINILDMPRWAKGYWRMDARIPQRWFIRPAQQEVI